MSNIVKNSKDNLGTMGGNVSKGIDTATSIVMGVINGDITGGLAGASAPWIAEQIKLHTGHKDEKGEWKVGDSAANYIAHAILGAVIAELQGNSGLAARDDDVGDMGMAISSSKNAVENNLLSEKDIEEVDKRYTACNSTKDIKPVKCKWLKKPMI